MAAGADEPIVPRKVEHTDELGFEGVVEPFIAHPKAGAVVHSVAFAIENGVENRDATPARVREEWIAAGANLATEILQFVED